MKVQVTEEKPSFRPLQVTILIETEEELKTLKTFARKNVSVPEFLGERGILTPEQRKILSALMTNITDKLYMATKE